MTVVRRYESTDEDWRLLAPLLPSQKRGGKWNDHATAHPGHFQFPGLRVVSTGESAGS